MTSLSNRSPRQRGVTLIETAIACSLLATVAVGVGGVMKATNAVSTRSHAELMASEKNRCALERIAAVLRSATVSSLAGFDGGGVASEPQFNQAVGMTAGALSLGPATTLRWQSGTACPGVTSPGEVVMTINGVPRRIADRVAAGGFSVTQTGSALRIHLETYSPADGGGVAHASGDTTVALRN